MDNALSGPDVARVSGQAGMPGSIVWLQLTCRLLGFSWETAVMSRNCNETAKKPERKQVFLAQPDL